MKAGNEKSGVKDDETNELILFSRKSITKNKSYRTTIDRKVDKVKNICYLMEIVIYI